MIDRQTDRHKQIDKREKEREGKGRKEGGKEGQIFQTCLEIFNLGDNNINFILSHKFH